MAGKRSDLNQKGWNFFLRGVVTLTVIFVLTLHHKVKP